MTPQERGWSRGDRFLMVAVGAVLLLTAAGAGWRASMNAVPQVRVPQPVLPVPNAFNFYAAAGDGVQEGSEPGTGRASSEAAPSLAQQAALVQENAVSLRTLRQGFAFPYQSPPIRSFSQRMPYEAGFRRLARVLVMEGQVRAARGNWNGAAGSCLDAIRLGEDVPRGGGLIDMLVGQACQAIGRRSLWGIIPHLTARQARAAARRLENIQTRHIPFADVLQQEEWAGQAGLLELMRQRSGSWPRCLVALGSPDGDQWKMTARLWMTSKRTIMADYTRYMDQAIRDARRPAANPAAPPAVPDDPVCQIFFPVFVRSDFHDRKGRAQNSLLLAALALQAYRQEHGAYPATLAGLVPGSLSAVPADPFAGSGLLRYRRTGKSYLLYSIGPNGKDDGGTPVFDQFRPAPSRPGQQDGRRIVSPDSPGDIVARVNMD